LKEVYKDIKERDFPNILVAKIVCVRRVSFLSTP
jgi:hypothetical protein